MSDEIRIIERGDPDEASDMAKAQEVAHTLERTYPNHPWLISFQGRVLVVRHLAISDLVRNEIGQDGFGFMIPPEKFRNASARAVHDIAINAGGQMLEMFHMKRGAWDGSEPILPTGWKRKQQVFN